MKAVQTSGIKRLPHTLLKQERAEHGKSLGLVGEG